MPSSRTATSIYIAARIRVKCIFGRIKSKIGGLAEVESTNFFLSLLIANPLISPTKSVV